MSGLLQRWRALLASEASTRSLALLRIGLALQMYARFAGDLVLFRHWTAEPAPLSTPGFLLLSLSFYVSTSTLLVGYRSRLSAAVAGAAGLYMVLGMGEWFGYMAWYSHHTRALVWGVALLALTPCGGSLSVDRWLALRRADAAGLPAPPERGPMWALHLIRLHVVAIYVWGTYAKFTWTWLSGIRMEQVAMYVYWGSDLAPSPLVTVLAVLSTLGAIVIELVLAVGLWFGAVRWPMFALGVGLHALIYWTLPVSTFTMTMIALYAAFLDPEETHAAFERLLGRG